MDDARSFMGEVDADLVASDSRALGRVAVPATTDLSWNKTPSSTTKGGGGENVVEVWWVTLWSGEKG